MLSLKKHIAETFAHIRSPKGVTLVELMVAMVLAVILSAGIFGIHSVMQDSFRRETMVVAAQRNVRGTLNLIAQEIRMAGFDRRKTDLFGLTDITMDAGDNGTLSFTMDLGDGGSADNGSLDANETITYALFDSTATPAADNFDLGRTFNGTADLVAGTAPLVAEKIEALGFVYAFDDDNDGQLDFNDDGDGIFEPSSGEGVYWAVDTDNDNILDTYLDTDFDGDIDLDDTYLGAGLPSNVNMESIRAVMVMVLARSKGPDLGYKGNRAFAVGYRRVPGNDSYRRRLLTTTVRCRNLGL